MNFFSSPIVFGPIKKINAIPEITRKIKRGTLSFKITSDSFKRFKNILSYSQSQHPQLYLFSQECSSSL